MPERVRGRQALAQGVARLSKATFQESAEGEVYERVRLCFPIAELSREREALLADLDQLESSTVSLVFHNTDNLETAALWRAELSAGRLPQDTEGAP